MLREVRITVFSYIKGITLFIELKKLLVKELNSKKVSSYKYRVLKVPI